MIDTTKNDNGQNESKEIYVNDIEDTIKKRDLPTSTTQRPFFFLKKCFLFFR